MKNKYLMLVLFLIVAVDFSQAQQVTKEQWELGFGLQYPRYASVNISPLNSNYGAFISLQQNFNAHLGSRLKVGYSHLEGEWPNANLGNVTQSTNLITGDLDLLYYFTPCDIDILSPYVYTGVGANYRMLENNATASLEKNALGSQFNLGGGVAWNISSTWSMTTEFGYHATNNSELDGTVMAHAIEANGYDSYWNIGIGLVFHFGESVSSKPCQVYSGITQEYKDMTDYNKIEDMIKKHIPKEIIKEVVVEKGIVAVSEDRLVLVGVNFAFDKSDLLPESYYVLDKAVKLLKDNPKVNVEIEGYTDYIGTEDYNQKLSIDRAQTVKDYLVSRGITANRLTTVGYGKGNPVANNETEEGRAMNRRIVFRILNK